MVLYVGTVCAGLMVSLQRTRFIIAATAARSDSLHVTLQDPRSIYYVYTAQPDAAEGVDHASNDQQVGQ